MPNYSGKWNLAGQLQGIKAGTWTGIFIESAEIYIWGDNGLGGIGNNSVIDASSPVQLGSDTDWNQLSLFNFALATKLDGSLYAWGLNAAGQLGLDDVVYRSSPVQVGALTNWSKVSASTDGANVIKTDGTLWGWGYNAVNGSVGDSTKINKSSPVQIGSDTDWSEVSNGGGHVLALKSSGELYAWGRNSDGQIGDGTTAYKSSPVQIGADTDWGEISAGKGTASAAVRTDGTLWTWGSASSGVLGNNTTTPDVLSPVQIGVLTNWAKVDMQDRRCLAIKTDGTLWNWGARPGDNTNIGKSSPVQIGSDTDWSEIGGGITALAVKTNGTLWAWGDNSPEGNIGDGTVIDRSSPVQIGALTNWTKPTGGSDLAGAVFDSSYRTGMS